MRYIYLAALVFNFLTWKYEKMDQDTITSQDKEKRSEKELTTLTEQMKDNENLTEPQFRKNSTMQNQTDQIDDTMDDNIKKEKEELVKKNTQPRKESLNKDNYCKDKVTTLMEEKTELEKQRDSLKQRLDELEREKEVNKQKPQAVEKNYITQNQNERLFFKPAFTALNLDTVFFILLIHTCGADLVQSISTLSQHMWWIVVLAELAFSFIPAVYAWHWKTSQHSSKKEGKNQDLDETKAKPQHLEKTNEELDNEVYKIIVFLCLRRILENHREMFKLQLEDVEREREDNKEKIHSVEKLITESEREKVTEKTEELLREKQKLLSAQWKLERRKEELEKVQLNTEKVLQSEEADGLLTRMTERKQNLEKEAYSLETNEELDKEVYRIIVFLCLRRILENHRELFKLQLEDVEGEREDNKDKIQSVEKLITESEREKETEKTEELLKEKQNLSSAQWNLERRKEELEKLQLNTEKVLQSEEADGLLTRMTERKEDLEKKEEGT